MLRGSRVLRVMLAGALVVSLLASAGCEIEEREVAQEEPVAAESESAGTEGAGVYTHAEVIESAEEAKALLEEGNERFVNDEPLAKMIDESRREALLEGQKPFAVIVSCSDSRVPPELVFDQALGDIFVIRVAGNVIDPVGMGSVEYAVEHLGTPLIVVMGHEKCGAVTATVEGGEAPGSIGSIVELIEPAVTAAEETGAGEEALVEAAVDENVGLQIAEIEKSPIVEEAVAAGELTVLGAKYMLSTGKVEWME